MEASSTTSRVKVTACGYSAEFNCKVRHYRYRYGFYAPVSETAKAIKAIAKAAGFTVLRATSSSYSMGDSVRITLASELTPEQKAENLAKLQSPDWYRYWPRDYHQEPRQELADGFDRAFRSGSYDSMTECYDYKDKDSKKTVEIDGQQVEITAKYVFIDFE